jgi:hypothetical protein
MLPEARVCRANFFDRTANPPGDSRSSPLSRVAQLAVTTSQTRCAGQLVNERIEFCTSGFGTGRIIVGISPFDVLLQFFNAPTIFATCLFVEHVSWSIGGRSST